MKPLLLLDVDGVISLFGFDLARPPDGQFHNVDGVMHFLSRSAGGLLRALAEPYELVWCTGWEDRANEYLPWALGLDGPLPFLSFERRVGRGNAHWKLSAIDAYAGPQRPLAWIDDALDERCERWAADRTGPTLLVRTEPPIGLGEPHVKTLLRWAAALPARGQ